MPTQGRSTEPLQLVALIVALTAAIAAIALLTAPAAAQRDDEGVTEVTPARIDGETRFHTAANVATATFQDVDVAILATGEDFPDALAAAFAAGRAGVGQRAPVLLTGHEEIPQPTADALERLGVEGVVLIGGSGAIGAGVESSLDAQGYDTARIAGADRFQTAAAVARAYGGEDIGTLDGQRTAILASGEDFPDALSAGPLATAGDLPLLLTPAEAPAQAVTDVLEELGVERILVVGGTAAVSADVLQFYADRGYEVERLGGATRTETAATVARAALERFEQFSAAGLLLARGDDFPDALAASPHAAAIGAPILLTAGPTALSPETEQLLAELCPAVGFVRALGGTAAVTEAVLDDAVRAAGQCLDGPPAETRGSWETLSEAPIERLNHSAVWSGERLYVWGGGDADVVAADGAAYDPAADAWSALPEAPIEARWAHEAVWGDGRMIVYGGSAGPDHLAECFEDGAAYDPDTGTWQALPAGPHTAGCATSAVWTGEELIVWGGLAGDVRPGEPEDEGAAYDPATGRWRLVPANPVGGRWGHDAVWTGERMIVFGGNDAAGLDSNEVAAYDPDADEWTELPQPPIDARAAPVVSWTGDELVVVGGTVRGDPVPDGAAYDPASGTWRTIADMPGRHSNPQADWSGELLLVVGGERDGAQPAAVAWDPETDEWTALAELPGGHRLNHTVTWTGDRLVVFGGQRAEGTAGGHAWLPN